MTGHPDHDTDTNEVLENLRPQFVRALADPRCELVEAITTDPMYDGKHRMRVKLTFLIPDDLIMDMSREEMDRCVLRVTTMPLDNTRMMKP